jgi:hypothetical protein
MILGFQWPVAWHYRFEMMEYHEGVDQATFLGRIWSKRNAEYYTRHGFPNVRGEWPMKRANELPLAIIQMPTRKRA